MKYLVTGGAGFGGALMGELQDRNEDVIQLSREIGMVIIYPKKC